jgi:hypothetical protein
LIRAYPDRSRTGHHFAYFYPVRPNRKSYRSRVGQSLKPFEVFKLDDCLALFPRVERGSAPQASSRFRRVHSTAGVTVELRHKSKAKVKRQKQETAARVLLKGGFE